VRDPVDDLIDDLLLFLESPRLYRREKLRAALKRWVKREVRAHALSSEEIA
jgi:hypothetical protein